jgi:hypothetical protein
MDNQNCKTYNITLYLKNGIVIKRCCTEEEFNKILNSWEYPYATLPFSGASFLTSEVAGFEWSFTYYDQ